MEVIDMNIKSVWSLIRETFQEWSQDKATRMAAALAYFTIFSMAPIIIIVIAVAGMIIGDNELIRQQILTQVEETVGAQAAGTVGTIIDQVAQPESTIWATIIGVGALLLGATGVVIQLQDSLNTIWEVKPREDRGIKGIIRDRVLSFAMILGLAFILLVALVINTFLSVAINFIDDFLPGGGVIWQIVSFVISLLVISIVFGMIFKILPDVEIQWSDVTIGALVTAVLFMIGMQVLSLYLGGGAIASTYGAAGSLVVILVWVFYSAQILFFGAEFTQVYARRHGSQIEPSEHARRISERERENEGIPHRPDQVRERAREQPSLQGTMIPVVGQQPEIHRQPVERVRYDPPNPRTVVPVITLGLAAGIYTIQKVVRRLIR
jgi:membrane protein